MSLVTVPVFDICLLKGSNTEVYEIYGANFCNGVMCPEFIGLYTTEGNMISEVIAAKKYYAGEKNYNFLTRYKIDINDPVKCNSIYKIFTIEE